MEVKHNVFLGFPPHKFDEKHPLFLNFGIFFHLDSKSNVDQEYFHIKDWLSSQKSILNFGTLNEFKKFIESLNYDEKNIINLAIFQKGNLFQRKKFKS